MKLLTLVTLLLTLQALPAQEAANGSIEGIVVSVTNNQPIEDAQVILSGSPGPPPATTGPDGKFVITGLKEGSYLLEIAGNGYVRQYFGQKTFPGEGTPIELAASENRKGITIRLTPTGTVSGRVRDGETGQPAAGVLVQLVRYVYTPGGDRNFRPFGSARTNDRGEYRLYYMTPGRYYVRVGGRPAENNPNEIQALYPSTYYPGVAQAQDASIVEVKPGANIGSIDVLLGKSQDLYRIRGRVLDSRTGRPAPATMVTLFQRVGTRWEIVENTSQGLGAGGSFDLRDIASGSYVIQVSSRPLDLANTPAFATKLTPVDVASSDVDGIVVSVSPGVSVVARVSVEGQADFARIQENLAIALSSSDSLLSNYAREPARDTVRDATLRSDHVAPESYRLSVYDLPDGFYVSVLPVSVREFA